MLEEALPIAIGVGAALLPAMAFGGLAAARAFIYLGAADAGVLEALESGKSEEEVMKMIDAASVVEAPAAGRSPVVASPLEKVSSRSSLYGFAARFLQ
jgi:uncharacterized membrane protein YhfC